MRVALMIQPKTLLKLKQLFSLPYNSMLFLKLTLLLSLLLLGNTCDTTISSYSCLFYLASYSDDCSNFTMDYCSWEVCDYYVQVGNSTQCGSWRTVTNNDWGTCIGHCCGYSGDSEQKYSTIQNCYDEKKRIAIIIGAVIGGVFGLIFIIFIICMCKDRLSSCCGRIRDCCEGVAQVLCCLCIWIRDRNQYPEPVVEIANPQAKFEMTDIKQIQLEMQAWSNFQQGDQTLSDTSCVICLSTYPTVKLQCGHLFHRKCIVDWTNKKSSCPLCLSTNMNNIAVFCERCYGKKMHKTATIHQLGTSKPVCCMECLG